MNQGNDKIWEGLDDPAATPAVDAPGDGSESPGEGPLGAIAQAIRDQAQIAKGSDLKLLALLRLLEALHQEIRDTLFLAALPESRQALYSLLRDIETSGGWPYIHRMRLHELMRQLGIDPIPTTTAKRGPGDSAGAPNAHSAVEK